MIPLAVPNHFVGRHRDLVTLGEQLTSQTGLVTINVRVGASFGAGVGLVVPSLHLLGTWRAEVDGSAAVLSVSGTL